MADRIQAAPKTLLAISGHDVLVTNETVPISTLRLNPENPRIRILARHEFDGRTPTDAQLRGLIRQQPAYDDLQKAIRKAGGIFEPIIVTHDGVVVEGNTRLTVFYVLHTGNPREAKWKQIQITRLPRDVPEEVLEVLMASYHVAGKTTWRPYVQADSIYQQHHSHGREVQDIADSMRMTRSEVEKYIEAYEFLIKEVLPHAEKGPQVLESKWSHALEFVKKKALSDFRQDPVVRKDVAKAIAQNRIKGAQVRELDKILKNRKAATALKSQDFIVARNVLRKADPVSTSQLVTQMRKLTEHIGHMDQKELELFRESKKAQTVLVMLAKKIQEAASIVGVTLRS